MTEIDEELRAQLEKIVDPVFVRGVTGGVRFAANRLAKRLQAESRFAVGGGILFRYQNGVYRPDGEEWVRQRVIEELDDEWTQARASEVVAYLRAQSPALLDAPPLDLINCRNGLLDLKTRQLLPHDPDLLTPVQIGAEYHPEAECPATERFISEVLPGDAVLLAAEIAGYLLVPDNSQQVGVMGLGRGANGKSTWLAQLRALIGEENVAAVPLHTLDENRFAPASLYGKLVNVYGDLDARGLQGTSTFKSITGGDVIQAERKFGQPFTFRPYCRLVFSANAAPPTSDSSEAFFRRWLIVPFEQNFSVDQREIGLERRLTTPDELSGLLNVALCGLERLHERGAFLTVESTARASQAFRLQADTVAAFVDENCDASPEGVVPKSELARRYRAWCQENGCSPLPTHAFNERVRSLLGLQETKANGERRWRGVALQGAP